MKIDRFDPAKRMSAEKMISMANWEKAVLFSSTHSAQLQLPYISDPLIAIVDLHQPYKNSPGISIPITSPDFAIRIQDVARTVDDATLLFPDEIAGIMNNCTLGKGKQISAEYIFSHIINIISKCLKQQSLWKLLSGHGITANTFDREDKDQSHFNGVALVDLNRMAPSTSSLFQAEQLLQQLDLQFSPLAATDFHQIVQSIVPTLR